MNEDGHFALFGTLDIGHTYPGVQRVQSWSFPKMKYNGLKLEDFVFIRPPGVEAFVLGPSNVWYGRVRLLFSISVRTDNANDPVEMKCAFISVCEEIKLNPSGMK
jgi:hypothetical protein